MVTRRTRAPADDEAVIDAAAAAAIAGGDELEDPVPLTAADRLALALEAAGDDGKAEVRIYKLGADDAFAWCETLSPEAYERSGYAALRTKWGAGEFKVALYGTTVAKGGKPGFGLRAWERITIAEDRSAPPPAAVAGTAPSELTRVLEQLAQGQQQLLAAIAQRHEPAPQVDQVAQMTQMLTMLKLMREATGDDRKAPTILDALKELRALKETGADLFGDTPREPEDPLSKALPGLLDIIKAQQAKGAGGIEPMPPVALPPSVAANEGEHDTPAQADDGEQLVAELRAKLDAIIALAAAGMDHEAGANIVYESLPDEMITLLEQPGWFEALVQFAPKAAPHREWLDQARKIALEWLAEDKAGTGDSARPDQAAA